MSGLQDPTQHLQAGTQSVKHARLLLNTKSTLIYVILTPNSPCLRGSYYQWSTGTRETPFKVNPL
jgi:hypothetical protein